MEGKYPIFDLCVKLRELDFPQKRKYQAMYYVTPNMLIDVADWSVFKTEDSKGQYNLTDVSSHMAFKPSLQDLIDESSFLVEFIRLSDGTIFAYSDEEEDQEYLESTGRQDKAIRARGGNHWEALANLYVAVANKRLKDSPRRTLTPEELEASENAITGSNP